MSSRGWLIAALVGCVLVSACSQFNTNLSIQTSSSTLSFVSPSTATIGSVPSTGLNVTATGTGFVSTGTFIIWNGVQLTNTVFVSSTQLTAVVPASDFATPGTIQVAVQIPGSAVSGTTNMNNNSNFANTTEISNVVNFTIMPMAGPAPTVSSLAAPSSSLPSTPYCSLVAFTLTVNGTNFASGAVVNWNGSARATTFVSSTQLTATILPTDTAFPGTAVVSVSSATGTSNSMPFTMTTPATSLPAPSITSLSQTSVAAGSPTFTLTVNGSSLLPCSVVQFKSTPKTTSFVSTSQLTATIPASDITVAGSANVTVVTIGPGGGTSPPVVFTIQ